MLAVLLHGLFYVEVFIFVLLYSVVDPDSTDHPYAEPDADPDSNFYSMLIRIRLFTLMRIRVWIQIQASK
jgi:hypothetical protein